MSGYYSRKLSGERLRRCYEIAPPRVQQYLEAEIRHALEVLRPTDLVLELGCGTGRIAHRLARRARAVIGIDTALESLDLARRDPAPLGRCDFLAMDALDLGFADGTFGAVLCLQNGICAFGVDPDALLREALRVTCAGGFVLLSSYSDAIWTERLSWFEAQAAEGLIGPIDPTASGAGVIVCADGFRAGRMTSEGFRALCARAGAQGEVVEVDASSVACRIVKPDAG